MVDSKKREKPWNNNSKVSFLTPRHSIIEMNGSVTFAQFWGPKNSFSPGGILELPPFELWFPLPDEPDEPEGVKE